MDSISKFTNIESRILDNNQRMRDFDSWIGQYKTSIGEMGALSSVEDALAVRGGRGGLTLDPFAEPPSGIDLSQNSSGVWSNRLSGIAAIIYPSFGTSPSNVATDAPDPMAQILMEAAKRSQQQDNIRSQVASLPPMDYSGLSLSMPNSDSYFGPLFAPVSNSSVFYDNSFLNERALAEGTHPVLAELDNRIRMDESYLAYPNLEPQRAVEIRENVEAMKLARRMLVQPYDPEVAAYSSSREVTALGFNDRQAAVYNAWMGAAGVDGQAYAAYEPSSGAYFAAAASGSGLASGVATFYNATTRLQALRGAGFALWSLDQLHSVLTKQQSYTAQAWTLALGNRGAGEMMNMGIGLLLGRFNPQETGVRPPYAAESEGFIGPTIGNSGYRTLSEFSDAATMRYQQLYNQGYSDTIFLVNNGLVANNPTVIGARVDSIARTGIRDWATNTNTEGLLEGPGSIIQVNRRLYDPAGSGRYRVPDVYIPGSQTILDGTIALKNGLSPQVQDFWNFSNGANVTIVRPAPLITNGVQSSYGIVP